MNHNHFLITLVVVASFVLEGYCAPAENGNVTIRDYCMKETGISAEKVKKIEDESAEKLDENSYCYLRCIFVAMQLIDDKGQLDVKATMKEFPEFKEDCLKKIPKIMQCKDMEELDKCDV